MKVSCDLINDLIPLYLEDMLSEDGKKFVEEHLSECPEQLQYVELYRKENDEVEKHNPQVERKNFSKPIKKMKKDIYWLIGKIAIFILSLSVFVGFIVLNQLDEGVAKFDSFQKANPQVMFNGENIVIKTDSDITAYSYGINPVGETKKKIVTIAFSSYKENGTNFDYPDYNHEFYLTQLGKDSPDMEVNKDNLDSVYYMDYQNNELKKIYGDKTINHALEIYNPEKMNTIIYYLLAALIVSILIAYFVRNVKYLDWISVGLVCLILACLIWMIILRFGLIKLFLGKVSTNSSIFGLSDMLVGSIFEVIPYPFIALISAYSIYKQLKRNTLK